MVYLLYWYTYNYNIVYLFFPVLVAKFNILITKTYEYWVNKIELTKTSVTSKKEIIHPNVDVSFLSFLVGIIDGDGYIQVRKKSNGYIEFSLVISFHNRDIATFEYILGKLHFGVIAKVNPTISKLVIYNYELKYILVPLLLKHGLFFLTENRINQYNLLLYTLENNIKKWELLPNVIPNYSPLVFNNPGDILQKVWYFKDWFVGFVIAEGSFFVQANKEISFSIGQKGNSTLMKAIHLFFETSRGIYYSSKNGTSLVRMSSVKDIQKVINFFSYNPQIENHHPLIGYKKDSYLLWLNYLKESNRYKDLNFCGVRS